MHELSIAHQIINQIETTLSNEDVSGYVKTVTLRIGALAGIVEDALRFGFDTAKIGTKAAEASIEIEHLPVIIHCPSCGPVGLDSIQSFLCTTCGQPASDLIQGRELQLYSIEVEDDKDGT